MKIKDVFNKTIDTVREIHFKENGVTLIALIVTIVVLIILAVISINLLFSENGIIKRTEQAAIIQELQQLEEQVKIRLSEEKISKTESKEEYNISSYTSLESFSPKIESKYSEYIRIEDGELYLKTNAPEEIKSVAESIGMQVKDNITNIRIYGESIQEGTPTPENPVEIQSVGDLVTDKADSNYGKYKIPVTISGKNIFDMEDFVTTYAPYQNQKGEFIESFEGESSVYKIYGHVNAEGRAIKYMAGKFKENTQYTCSTKIYDVYEQDAEGNYYCGIIMQWVYTDGTADNMITNRSNNHQWVELSTNSNGRKTVSHIAITYYTGAAYTYMTDFQIEEGNTQTSYEECQEPITTNIYLNEPLRKVGDIADYIDFATGKVVRNIGYYQIQGTEDWSETYMDEKNSFVVYAHLKELVNKEGIAYTKILNTLALDTGNYRFKYTNYSGETFGFDHAYENFKVSNLNDFKAKLRELKPEFIYILAAPTEESIALPNISKLRVMKNVNVGTKMQPSKIDIIK